MRKLRICSLWQNETEKTKNIVHLRINIEKYITYVKENKRYIRMLFA